MRRAGKGISQKELHSMYSTERKRIGCHRSWAALLACLFLLPGPSATAAQEPAAGVATITGSKIGTHKFLRGLNEVVIITRIDHTPMLGTMLGAGFLPPNPNTETLPPGRHRLGVRFQVGNVRSSGRLWLDAEAGKAYIVRARNDGRRVFFWIEEVDTGRTVGGIDAGEDSDDDPPPTSGAAPTGLATVPASSAVAASGANPPDGSSPTAPNE
jgi:hypothetical protein